MGILRQFDKAHTVFEIGLICVLMPLDVSLTAVLFDSPLSRHLFEKGGIDGAVEFIDIGGVDTVLEPFVFGAQPFDGFLVLTPFVGMAVMQGIEHPVENLVIEYQTAKERVELLFENLFPNIRFAAFPLVAGAMVINVTLFLDFPDNRAAAVAAGDQAREREIMLHAAMLAGVAPVHHVLHSFPQVPRDQGLMAALVETAIPFELAHVKPVSEDLVHRAGRHRLAALAVTETSRACLFRDIAQRQAANRIPFEHLGHMRRGIRVRLDHPLAVCPVHVSVSQRRCRRPDTLLGLLQHALAGLLG